MTAVISYFHGLMTLHRLLWMAALCLPALSYSQNRPADTINWLTNKTALVQLADYLDDCSQLGLTREDYDDGFLQAVTGRSHYLLDASDSMAAEAKLTYMAEAFFRDVVMGKRPDISYDGLHYSPDCVDVTGQINASIREGTFAQLLDKMENKSPEYTALKNRLYVLNDSLLIIQKDSAHRASNTKLVTRFETNINSVIRAMNNLRWMSCLLGGNDYTIIVNLPSATLLLYNKGELIFESKVIVGKRSTRTPLFISRLTDVTIYPYWYVPKSIATKELLPMIRKNIGYISENNFQVLDRNGSVLDPYTINWQALSAANFPFTIRQSTGCDNSLGILKMNINHPNNVYLHDTPWKVLFESASRFYSHGCIRVQNAKGLAHVLLGENSIAVDTLDEQANPLEHRPRVLPLNNRVVVAVLYNTAWFDTFRTIRFYPDIYSRFKKS